MKILFFFPNEEINILELNPIINYTDGKILRFSSSVKTKYFFDIDKVNFSSDEGLFFESNISIESYQIGTISNFQDMEIGGELFSGTFGIIGFKGSGRQINYHRYYKKIESLFPLFYTTYYFSILFFKFLVKFLLQGNLEEFLFYKLLDLETFSKFKDFNRKLRYENLFSKNTNHNRNNIRNNISNNNNIISNNINNDYTNKCLNEENNRHLNLNKFENESSNINNNNPQNKIILKSKSSLESIKERERNLNKNENENRGEQNNNRENEEKKEK